MRTVESASRFMLAFIGLFLFLDSATTAKGQPEKELESITIQLKWRHQFQFAGYYAAKEKGFYADEGLDVRFREIHKDRTAEEVVLAGEAQYGISDSRLLYQRMKGDPVVLVAQIFQNSPSVFLSKKGSGIRTPWDMVGKRVMWSPSSYSSDSLLAMLENTIGDVNQIISIPHEYTFEKFLKGEIDVISSYLTDQPFHLKQYGIEVNVINPRVYGIDDPGDNLFTTESEIIDFPGRTERVRRATIRGWEYALEHPEEIIELIEREYNQDLSHDALVNEARLTALVVLPELFPIGSVNREQYRKMIQVFKSLGLIQYEQLDASFFYEPSHSLSLSEEEVTWLQQQDHPIKVRIANFPPLEMNKSEPDGYYVDMFSYGSSHLGVDFQFVASDASLSESLEQLLKEDGRYDLIPFAKLIDSEIPGIVTTKPYGSTPIALYTVEGNPDIQEIQDIAGKTISTGGFTMLSERLRTLYPTARIIDNETIRESLEGLAVGQIDALIGNQTIIDAMLKHPGFSSLQKRCTTPLPEQCSVVAAREEFAPLLSILNKLMNSMPSSQRLLIRRKWIDPKVEGIVTSEKIGLTIEEEIWLKNHPVIQLGFSSAFEPMLIRNQNGTFSGTLGDVARLVEERIPLKIEIIDKDMGEIFNMVESGQIDGVLGLGLEKGKELGYLQTKSHSDYPYTIFSKTENVPYINDYADLSGRKVAIARGNVSALKRLIEAEPNAIPIEVDTVLEGMRALYANEVYAFAGHSIWNYQIVKYQLSGIKPAFIDIEKGKAFTMGFAINRDWPEFISIINKVLASIPPDTVAAINHRWSFYESGSAHPHMGLNEDEQARLWGMEKVVLASLRNWPPFDIINRKGIYEGLNADYINLLSDRLGLPVEVKLYDEWDDVLQSAKTGETSGALGVVSSPIRKQDFILTVPYIVNPVAGIKVAGENTIKSWNDLNGKKLIIVDDSILATRVMRELENVRVISVPNAEEGLKRLESGDGDIFLGLLASSSYQVDRLLMSDVKIAFKQELAESHLTIGTNRDDPVLASILNKAVESISQQEHLAIQRKWLDGSGASVVTGSPILPESSHSSTLVMALRNLAFAFLLMALMLVILWEIKGRPTKLSIRHTLFAVSFIFSFLIIAIAGCATLLLDFNEKQDNIDRKSRKSRELANEIKESTEELSNFACDYSVTGDPKFEEFYWIVQEVREGKRPHPSTFTSDYWEVLSTGYIDLDVDGEVYSLADKLDELDIPEKARDLLRESIGSFQPALEMELTAINAVKGLFRDEKGAFTRQSQPDMKFARELLHGEAYENAIADILKPIHEFLLYLDWSSAEERQQVREYSQAIILLISVLTAITIVFAVYTFILLKRRILSPLKILERDASRIALGEYDQITPLNLEDEIGILSNTFRMMATSIRDRTEKLEASESRMQFLLSSSPVVIYSRSIQYPFKPTYITPNIESVIGLSPDVFLRNDHFWIENIHPEDRDKIVDDLSRIHQTGRHTCEYRFRLKDGHYHWFMEEIKLVLDHEGKPSEMIGYWLDITQRKLAESELKKLSRAVDQGPAILMITDEHRRIQYVNPAFTKSTGYSANEAVGQPSSLLRAPGMLSDEYYQNLKETISSGSVWHGELCNRKKNGELFWEAATIAPVFQDSGKISHYVALKVDITDRKISEDAVKRQNERLRSLQQIVSGPEQSEEEVLQSILREACRLLDMDRAYLANVIGSSCVIQYAYPEQGVPELGKTYSLSAACCGLANEKLPPIMEHDLHMSEYRDTECCFKLNNAAYAGGGVKTSRGYYGILAFIRATPRPARFEEQDQDFLEVISGLCSSILERITSRAELMARANELEVLNGSMVDREMRVIKLKEKVNELSGKLGMDPPYETVWNNDVVDPEGE